MSVNRKEPAQRRIGRGAQRVPKRRFRPAILDAALEVFAEEGFHQAQMGAIAQRARVAVGTVYNLFHSKADLYRELVEEHAAEIIAAFNELLESELDPLDKLIEYVRIKGEVYEENQAMVKLFFSEGRGARVNVRGTLGGESLARYDMLLQRLAEIFEQAVDGGQVEDLDPFDLALALDSLSTSFIVLHMDHPGRHSYSKKIPTILRMFFGPVVTSRGRTNLEKRL